MSFIVGRRAGERLAGTLLTLFSAVVANALECEDGKAH
jgi:hypothetical protein